MAAGCSRKDLEQARAAAGWRHGPFEVPSDIAAAWRTAVGGRNAAAYEAWQARVAALPGKSARICNVSPGVNCRRTGSSALPISGAKWSAEAPTRSTNEATADIVALLADAIPELIAGAPDLEGPTNCKRTLAAFSADNRAGRYVHYGIREHAMGAMINGMAAHGGVLPLGATYFVFSDYMRPRCAWPR